MALSWLRSSTIVVHDRLPTWGENSVVHNVTGTSLIALTFSVTLAAHVIASRTLPGASRPLRLNRYAMVLLSLPGAGRMSEARGSCAPGCYSRASPRGARG